MRSPVTMLLAAAAAWAQNRGAPLVRTYPEVFQVVDLRVAPPLLLAAGGRIQNCGGKQGKCLVPVVAVHDTRTGERIASLEGEESGYIVAGRFKTADSAWIVRNRTLVEWNFRSGRAAVKQENPDGFVPRCVAESGAILGTRRLAQRSDLAFVAAGDSVRRLRQPPLGVEDIDCANRASDRRVLVKERALKRDSSLAWISMDGLEEPIECGSFPGERIFGFATTPDGAKVAVISGEVHKGDEEPLSAAAMEHRVFLYVLEPGKGCRVEARFALDFPERPVWKRPLLAPGNRYLSGAYLEQGFARQMAISPDGTKIAVAYGVLKSHLWDDALAFAGLYDSSSGRRLGTLRGGTVPNGLLTFLRTGNDRPSYFAAISGPLWFSADSKRLFFSSGQVLEFDVSGLR